jgi:hypothetical protein
MEHKWHEEGRKDLKVQNGSKGKEEKKIPSEARNFSLFKKSSLLSNRYRDYFLGV